MIKRYFHIILFLTVTFLLVGFSSGPKPLDEYRETPPFLKETKWADSVLKTLSLKEKIAQLMMVAAYSNRDEKHVNHIDSLIEKYKIGGLIFFQGGPVRQINLLNHYQKLSKIPLLISTDAEWGLAMRLDSTVEFPHQMMLGAIQDETLIYEMGKEIGQQCKRLGIHVNLAPVVDINTNPNNPVINSRSFGEDKKNVARKAVAYMKGLQDVGIMSNAKHFPGHGDTDTDSHKTLPTLPHDKKRIDTIELYPFRQLIRGGVSSVMIAHLYGPSLDKSKNQAATLSKKIVTKLLKDSLGFKGLVFTDALNMKGVSQYYKPGILDVKALLAGNEVLLYPEDVPTAIREIEYAIKKGKISEKEIDKRCLKVLQAKKWTGLDKIQPVKKRNLFEDLHTVNSDYLNHKMVESSMTLLKNKDNILPLNGLDTLKVATLVVGDLRVNNFQKRAGDYTSVTNFNVPTVMTDEQIKTTIKALDPFDVVLVNVHGKLKTPNNFGVPPVVNKLVNELTDCKRVVLSVLANPYCLKRFKSANKADAIIMGYQDMPLTQDYAAQLIFGGFSPIGRLPVTASKEHPIGAGLSFDKIRLQYSVPEAANMNAQEMKKIDSLVYKGIKAKAFPGCQVLVAKDGKVVYSKSFGHHTYEKRRQVKTSDIYDLASITKITASVGSMMKLESDGKVQLDYYLCDYLDYVDSTEYYSIILREMLAHQAQLVSWIPFYAESMVRGQLRYDLYSKYQSPEYPHRVANNIYMTKEVHDTLIYRILRHPRHKRKEYRYSDLGYYFLKDIIEKQSGMPLNEFVAENFYKPLGASTLGYLPRERFDLNRVVPTEHDMFFRKQLVHGDVHDPGAAMLGGVGGHAGLFSSANDLAKMMQMYLQKGEYGGIRYLDSNVVKEYTSCQYCEDDNRRGAGFDRPSTTDGGPTCDCTSTQSYGHTGFTGTMTWVDPESKLVYVFLSNRVYPDANNKKLIKMNLRTDIMQVIYDSIEEEEELVKN